MIINNNIDMLLLFITNRIIIHVYKIYFQQTCHTIYVHIMLSLLRLNPERQATDISANQFRLTYQFLAERQLILMDSFYYSNYTYINKSFFSLLCFVNGCRRLSCPIKSSLFVISELC